MYGNATLATVVSSACMMVAVMAQMVSIARCSPRLGAGGRVAVMDRCPPRC